jgi:hypothetical protein
VVARATKPACRLGPLKPTQVPAGKHGLWKPHDFRADPYRPSWYPSPWREGMARRPEEIEQHDRADQAAEAAFDIYKGAKAPDKRRLLHSLCLNLEFRV